MDRLTTMPYGCPAQADGLEGRDALELMTARVPGYSSSAVAQTIRTSTNPQAWLVAYGSCPVADP